MEQAKEVVKAFGCSRGIWMHRKKYIYEYEGVEWSIVEAPKQIFFFEAELMVGNEAEAEGARQRLVAAAEALQLAIFTPEEYYEFVSMLGREVNKNIAW